MAFHDNNIFFYENIPPPEIFITFAIQIPKSKQDYHENSPYYHILYHCNCIKQLHR